MDVILKRNEDILYDEYSESFEYDKELQQNILSNINNKIEANISYEYLNEDTKCDLKELSKCSNSNFNYEIGKVTIQNDKIIKMDFHK